MKSKRKKISKHSAVILASFLFILMMTFRIVNASEESRLYLQPTDLNLELGSDFSISAMIDPGNKSISAVELNLAYDDNKFEVIGGDCSSVFPEKLYPGKETSISSSAKKGMVRLDCAVNPSGSSIKDISEVAELSFRAVSPVNASAISISEKSIAAADGEDNNVITSRGGILISTVGNSKDEDNQRFFHRIWRKLKLVFGLGD
jgi:hypothetical protein